MNKNQTLRLVAVVAAFIIVAGAFMYLAWQVRYEDQFMEVLYSLIAALFLMSALLFADDYSCEISGSKPNSTKYSVISIVSAICFLTLTILAFHWTEILWAKHPWWSVIMAVCGIPSLLGLTVFCLLCYFLADIDEEVDIDEC